MEILNLPKADIKLRKSKDGIVQVYDPIRRRWLILTPEEWVRQNFVEFLVCHRDFPRGRIGNEISLRLNGTLRRCDTIVFDSNRKPLVVIEYKAPEITITEDVFCQILRYNSVLCAPFLIVSNGLRHYCCRATFSPLSCKFLQDIPRWNELKGFLDFS